MKDFDFIPHSGVFIIAELSANHNGSFETAVETIRAAKRAGADAIKLQTYTADTLTLNSNKDDFIINNGSIWDGKKYYELYQQAYTPWEWHEDLFRVALDEDLICFSSPFDRSAVDFLEQFNPPAYKIASFEITDIPLIRYVASKGKPIILSTGIATSTDIEMALKTIRNEGNDQIALLKCTSSYPAQLNEANLIMIQDLRDRYQVVSGLSDHTLGTTAAVVATCFGAKIIEKHFILDKSVGGPDASFSLDEKEFSKMVQEVRNAQSAIGQINYSPSSKQLASRDFSRSLYVVKNVKAGETLTHDNIRSIRPGFGLHPKYLDEIIGLKFSEDCIAGDRLHSKLIASWKPS